LVLKLLQRFIEVWRSPLIITSALVAAATTATAPPATPGVMLVAVAATRLIPGHTMSPLWCSSLQRSIGCDPCLISEPTHGSLHSWPSCVSIDPGKLIQNT